MSEPPRAVFLSYASQDAEAAQRICEALRAASIEVWFDQSELRGGDAWDATIRKQIKTCALFIPIVSRNTRAREEGYFRLEWKLAVDRSHQMTTSKTFLLPVVIDDTIDDDEQVPDKFREVQWTRLPEGKTPPAFIERVSRLLSPDQRISPPARPPDGSAPGTAPASTAPAAHPGALSRSRLALLLIATAVVIAVGYYAADRLLQSRRSAEATLASAPSVQPIAPAPSTTPEKSIAVLPFVDMSERHDQEYFSDGLSEELIDLLTRVPELHVPARTSSFYFKGKPTTISDIAKALKVAHVLEGSVRKSGNTVRITAQLIRVDDGYHVWSETYDRDLKDIFRLQDEIAGRVVRSLKATLLDDPRVVRTMPSSVEAHNLYLQGRYFASRRTVAAMTAAIDYFEKAVQREPGYAAAWAALAYSYSWSVQFGNADVAATTEKARRAAKMAIGLDPQLPEGHTTMALINTSYDFDWASARSELDRALAADGGDPEALLYTGQLDYTFGDQERAIQRYRDVLEVDPLRADGYMFLGRALHSAGRFEEAAAALRSGLNLNPGQVNLHLLLGLVQLAQNRTEEARLTIDGEPAPWYRLTGLAIVNDARGRRADADSALTELRREYAAGAAAQIAQVFGHRSDRNAAFEWLERAYTQRDAGLRWIKVDPLYGSLRADPRYRALLHKLNLPE